MKTAIVYDRVNKWGGAERVLLSLHDIFPKAPLYTSVYEPEKAPWANVFPKIYTSFLNKFSFLRDKHDLLAPFMPMAFEQFDFSHYDLVISVTSESAKGIITNTDTKHICYCLTPTRYLWSGYEDYFNSQFRRAIAYPAVQYLRYWDKIASSRPDFMIAISEEVKNRIKSYYDRECEIIHPPLKFEKNEQTTDGKIVREDEYYLVVSRLVPYKKVDLVVEVFNELKLPLVIVGVGSEEKRLRKMSFSHINYSGFVTESQLIDYYKGSKALVFPQHEDFGLTAVEAQFFGKPVIAYKKGGALDSVIEGETGTFFENQDKESLRFAVKRIEKMQFEKEKIRENALKFSDKVFKKKFQKLISEVMKKRNSL